MELIDGRRYPIAVGHAAILLSVAMASLPAAAAGPDDAESSYLATLKDCRAQTDPTARLDCFDRAVAEMIAAEDAGDLRLVDREEVRKTRRSLFGFSLPDLGIFGKRGDGDSEEDEIKELETTVAAVGGSYSTGYTIRTAEGAVWRISDVPRRMLTPKVGEKMVIKSGALSAYFVRIGDQGGVKAVRIK